MFVTIYIWITQRAVNRKIELKNVPTLLSLFVDIDKISMSIKLINTRNENNLH